MHDNYSGNCHVHTYINIKTYNKHKNIYIFKIIYFLCKLRFFAINTKTFFFI